MASAEVPHKLMKNKPMKKTLVLLTALLGGASAIAADESASSYSVTVDFPFVSKYVFRGVEVSEEAAQPSVEVTAGNAYFGVWSSIPIKDSQKATRELDLYAGYNIALSETIKLDAGATYYYYPEAPTGWVDHSLEGYLGVNLTAGGFTPSFYVYRDFDLDVWTLQGSLGYSIPVPDMGTSLDWTATLGLSRPDDSESWTYFSVGLNVPFKVTEKFKITAGANYTINDSNVVSDPGVWFSLGGTYAF